MEYIKKPTNVYWDLLVILLSGTIIFSQTVFFLVSTVYLLILIQKNHFKILLPKIGGLKLYIFLVVWGGVLGYYLYPIRNVARDIFYFTSTLLWILIGANFIKNKRGASLLLITRILYDALRLTLATLVLLPHNDPFSSWHQSQNSSGRPARTRHVFAGNAR